MTVQRKPHARGWHRIGRTSVAILTPSDRCPASESATLRPCVLTFKPSTEYPVQTSGGHDKAVHPACSCHRRRIEVSSVQPINIIAMQRIEPFRICDSGLTAIHELLARGFNVTATEGESAG